MNDCRDNLHLLCDYRAIMFQPSRRAFTLVELISVLIIVGIMAAVAVPSLSSVDTTRQNMAVNQLLRDVTFAQQRAIATGTRHWVVFNTAAETWSVLAEDPANPGRTNAAVVDDPGTNQPFIITLNITPYIGVQLISATFDGNTEIGFDWIGRPLNNSETSLAAQGSVALTGGGGITVAVGTGHIDRTDI